MLFLVAIFIRRSSDKAKEDVKRWTRKHDIFTKKYVVVPINEGFVLIPMYCARALT